MQFAIDYNGEQVMIDVASWESTIDSRIEFYAVFAHRQETFVNFVKRTNQPNITEVSSSADLTANIKAVIMDKIVCCIQQASI